jgi:hypothetical protein
MATSSCACFHARLGGRSPSGRQGGDAQPRPLRHCRTGARVLAQLQRAACLAWKYYTVRPHTTGFRHNALLEATVSGILAAELQSDHPAPDDWDLFNVVATHLSDDHLPHVIQERRETRQCLACGESSSLWRFQDGPKVKAQSELMQVLREWTRRDRATRGRAAEGRAHSTGRIDTVSWDAAHGPCR